ncbi:Bug family tripartite tricarboxylate transporter substrate binding protein [Roseomonas populi]|uniref:Tripartite tricarboxylate transporter substrate binding protein n=1 Tax=Roseomonas populi TaxID=3121582 RepID=A0ABT1XBQ1_9PROT|nr:tripartite tricarboxylate transporter substrate binding protein [Roseomonas pecuniae]MCR0985566.1 tripartite tricarboxylate transporter substrate binding protein [Roseomonas pecuniae]
MAGSTRRGVMVLGLLATGGSALAVETRYPERAVTLVVPAAPGGGGDFTARLLNEALTRSLGQPFVVENRVGGSGNVASIAVARAAPDGYTLLLAYSGTHVANPALFPNLSWDPVRSFAPVALVLRAPHVVVVRKDLPARTLAELAELARRSPGRLTYASSGAGTIQHIGGEQFARLVGAPMVHVPYRGAGPAMNDLVAGNIDLMITTPPSVAGLVRDGSVRALAIAGPTRHSMLPDVPTAGQAGFPGFELEAWFAVYAPAGTPQPAVERLSAEIGRVVATPEFRRRCEESGTYAAYMNPTELAAFTGSELARWSELIQRLGIRAE